MKVEFYFIAFFIRIVYSRPVPSSGRFLLLSLLLLPQLGRTQTITDVIPASNQVGVAVNTNILVGFSEPMSDTAASRTFIGVYGSQSGKQTIPSGGIFYGGGSPAISFDPAKDFKAGERVSVTITGQTPAASGNTLGKPLVYQFSTATTPSLAQFEAGAPVTSNNPAIIRIGDIDGDGDLDMISSSNSFTSGHLTFHINNGRGSFSTGNGTSVGNSISEFSLADLDGDGDLDLVVSNFALNTNLPALTILLNDGKGAFTVKTKTYSDHSAYKIIAADLDGDLDLDLALGCSNVGHVGQPWILSSLIVLQNDGAANFSEIYQCINASGELAAEDIDNDGDIDLSIFSKELWHLVNDGSGHFTLVIPYSYPTPILRHPPMSADLDNDGDSDWVGIGDLENITVVYSNGVGGIESWKTFPKGQSTVSDICIADLDGDGDADLALSTNKPSEFFLMLNDGKGQFTATSTPLLLETPYISTIEAGDLDGDGDLDLAIVHSNVSGLGEPLNTISIQFNKKATSLLTWNNPADIVYGTPLSGTQLNANASIPGTFTYSLSVGTILSAGFYPITVTFRPDDALHYETATASTSIQVRRATPVLNWLKPASIPYGTPLSALQLCATADVPGTFAYAPVLGTALNAGNNQVLSVVFQPSDAINYNGTILLTTRINVLKSISTITWVNPADISVGNLLSENQLNAVANVPGTFTYSPAPGTILGAGANQTLSVNFVPNDANYTSVQTSVKINVTGSVKSMPSLNWDNPVDISYGTALMSAQLNATASVPGTFVYSPAAGTVLEVGTAQVLSVSFTPTDFSRYQTGYKTVKITVGKSTPVISWVNPEDIIYGSSLSGRHLNAASTVAGTFTYTPPSGTFLNAGNNQSLSVLFTPTDATHYTSTQATVPIRVMKATPSLSWSIPADMVYGAPLSLTQLNASTSVDGTFEYTPAEGTVLAPGDQQMLSVRFNPRDESNFEAATFAVPINIKPRLVSVQLTQQQIPENQPVASLIGTFAITGALANETFQFALVTRMGNTDQVFFSIAGNRLQAGVVFDFEQQPQYSLRIKATGSAGSQVEQDVTITIIDVNDLPTLDFIPDPQPLSANTGELVVPLTGIGPGTGEKQRVIVTVVSDQLDLIPLPKVEYTSGTTGYLRFTPVANASGTATVYVTVDDGQAENHFITRHFTIHVEELITPTLANSASLPTLFSPNSDGQNDHLKVRGNNILALQWTIQDRNGNIMYQTSAVEEAMQKGWDGTYQGHIQPSGSYSWYLTGRFTDGQELKVNQTQNAGVINLVR